MLAQAPFDVVVIGGGPAGSAAAITLARAGARVLLAEAVASVSFKIGESLPSAAHPLLRDLGLAARVARAGHLPCPGTVAVWGGVRPEERDFIRELHGSGLRLDRPRFDADLRAAADEAGAVVRLECVLDRVKPPGAEGGRTLWFRLQGKCLPVSTRWVIDASGRRALIASREGAKGVRDDALTAFCTVLPAGDDETDARTGIEAVEDGWWYSALLPGRRRLLAFFTDDDLPAAGEATSAAGFARRLAGTLFVRPASFSPTALGRIRRFPTGGLSRRAFAGDGWLAVGDASLAFDPLSSQGLFHALYTGLRGAETVLACAGGDRSALAGWQDRLLSIRAAYRHHLAQCYGAESRWSDAPFWRRRQSGPAWSEPADSAALAGAL